MEEEDESKDKELDSTNSYEESKNINDDDQISYLNFDQWVINLIKCIYIIFACNFFLMFHVYLCSTNAYLFILIFFQYRCHHRKIKKRLNQSPRKIFLPYWTH